MKADSCCNGREGKGLVPMWMGFWGSWQNSSGLRSCLPSNNSLNHMVDLCSFLYLNFILSQMLLKVSGI